MHGKLHTENKKFAWIALQPSPFDRKDTNWQVNSLEERWSITYSWRYDLLKLAFAVEFTEFFYIGDEVTEKVPTSQADFFGDLLLQQIPIIPVE